jgi:hypothetical protein
MDRVFVLTDVSADHAETSTERSSTKHQIADFLGYSSSVLRNISHVTNHA